MKRRGRVIGAIRAAFDLSWAGAHLWSRLGPVFRGRRRRRGSARILQQRHGIKTKYTYYNYVRDGYGRSQLEAGFHEIKSFPSDHFLVRIQNPYSSKEAPNAHTKRKQVKNVKQALRVRSMDGRKTPN